jgi:hypothetical protein
VRLEPAREIVAGEEVLHDLELAARREAAALIAIARRVHATGRRATIRHVALVEHQDDGAPLEPRVKGGQKLVHPPQIDVREPERGQAAVEAPEARHIGVPAGPASPRPENTCAGGRGRASPR